MRYLSTRDPRPAPAGLSFEDVLLAGVAPDGGLYLPEALPQLAPELLRPMPYAERAAQMVGLFAGESFAAAELRRLADDAYVGFKHPAVAPLVQLDDGLWLLELFHGPTLAFKDLALQLVGGLFDAALARRGEQATIIGATSGDTGSAAMAACGGRDALDIFMLYPHDRISEVQRRQMTTVAEANAHAIAIEGTFDDCQDLVKALFADEPLRHELGLAAVNSINWARIAAQTVYYAAAAAALGGSARPVSFSVPSGNFGNAYAGHVARRMGVAIDHLVIGTNRNDVLARYLATGEMRTAAVEPSLSPSMDIQVPSNFERLLFELKGRSGGAIGEAMGVFRRAAALPADEQAWRAAQGLFSAYRVDDTLTMETIADVYRATGMLIDPHTAVAVAAARAARSCGDTAVPMVALATAHAAKFPDAVARATGIRPVLPPSLAGLSAAPERITRLPNDAAAVKAFVVGHARRGGGGA